MAISLGISAADQATFVALLGQSHHISVSLSLMDLSHNRISSLSDVFLGGQVTVDDDADVSRSASLTFLDPDHKMALDSDSPADAAMYIDRMIGIVVTVYSPDRSFWTSVPVFCGPITKMDRDWAMVRVECMGKEILALDPFWSPRTFRKGARRTDVVKSLLSALGEERFTFTNNSSKLTKDLALSSESKPWTTARSVARSANLQLFYDGRGVAVMRPFPTVPVMTFTDGPGGLVVSKPQIGYDSSNIINAVHIKGAIPKGKKTPLSYRVIAPVGSPVYPYKIGRNGKPRVLPVQIDDDSIDTLTEAKSVAARRLDLGALETVTAAFDILPAYHLQERDPYRIATQEVSTTTIVTKMTIPLQANETAAIGYLKSLKPNVTNIRRRK
jgi:hypothetical protein